MKLNFHELDFLLKKLEKCSDLYLVIEPKENNSYVKFSLITKIKRAICSNSNNSISYLIDGNKQSQIDISFDRVDEIEMVPETNDNFCYISVNDSIVFATNMAKEHFLFMIERICLLAKDI